MWRFKGCPKCNGDIFLEKDFNGWYEKCLQCGNTHDLQTIVGSAEIGAGNKKKRKLVGAGKNYKK